MRAHNRGSPLFTWGSYFFGDEVITSPTVNVVHNSSHINLRALRSPCCRRAEGKDCKHDARMNESSQGRGVGVALGDRAANWVLLVEVQVGGFAEE